MVTVKTFRQIVLSFQETTEQPHFEKASFRIGKKIFATLDVTNNQACIKLSQIDQSVFSAFDKTIIFPVPNKWGKQGWTCINLNTVHEDMLIDALTTAYAEATSKMAKKKPI
jgi:predicted DNA-binding protein (MmcQ/YjbR family)